MKNNFTLLSIVLSFSVFYNVYGYEVSTNIQKKNVLIEEFTGIGCGNCPDGHKMADIIKMSHPENIYIVAIHSGHYADPYDATAPDYRTEEGENLDLFYEAYNQGYPCGMINRRTYDGAVPGSRAFWTERSKETAGEDANVNLLMKASYDNASREVVIDIEGYYTAEWLSDSVPTINVLWTQSGIEGPQNGGDAGDNYIHQHMLRGYLTTEKGEALDKAEKGAYFSRTYTMTLPEEIRNVPVKPEDIEIIAFVSEGRGQILNVTGGKPEYKGLEVPLAAELSAPRLTVGARYGYRMFDVQLTNKANVTIENASFDIDINGETFAYEWQGSIAPFTSQEITVRTDEYTIGENNTFSITLKKMNGTDITPVTYSGSFQQPVESSPNVTVTIKTDLDADENRFLLKDEDGNIVKEFGPYEAGKSETYKEQIWLEENRVYCLEITDEWGNGLRNKSSEVKIHSDGKKLIAQEFNITGFGTRCFFRTSLKSAIEQTDIESQTRIYRNGNCIYAVFPDNAERTITLYSVTGSIEASVQTNGSIAEIPTEGIPSGIYLLQAEKEKSKEIYKIILK